MSSPANLPTLAELEAMVPSDGSLSLGRTELEDRGVHLPRFVELELPARAPEAVIHHDGEAFVDPTTGISDESIDHLYHLLTSKGFNVRFHHSIKPYVQGIAEGILVFSTVGEDGEMNALMFQSQREDIAADDYRRFLIAFRRWEAHPTASTAWGFLDRHPVFWTYTDQSGWITDGRMQSARMFYYEQEGQEWAAIESGETDPGNWSRQVNDPRLFVRARNMERAVKTLAEKVLSIHGLAREDDGVQQHPSE